MFFFNFDSKKGQNTNPATSTGFRECFFHFSDIASPIFRFLFFRLKVALPKIIRGEWTVVSKGILKCLKLCDFIYERSLTAQSGEKKKDSIY